MDGVVNLQTNPNYMNIPNNKKTFNHNDPYSIYDDDSSATHYFLVPAIKDPQKFVTKFQELNRLGNSNTSRPNNTSSPGSGYINDRQLRRSQSQRTRTRSCGGLDNRNRNTTHLIRTVPTNKKPCSYTIPPPPSNTIRTEDVDEDYCTIKAECQTDFKPSRTCVLSSANTRLKKEYIKREHLPEFTPILKKQLDEYEDDKKSCCKLKNGRKNGKDVDRYIEMCTCIYCVRSVSYNCTGDDDGSFVEPCSCQGSTKSVIGRYVCMGLMAVFLPCMLCYLPAKCCRSRKSQKHKHIHDDTFVHYQSNNNKETL